MRRIIISFLLAVNLFACEQQHDPAPNSNPEQGVSVTDDVVNDLITKTATRISPTEGISANASGPAAMGKNINQSTPGSHAVAAIPFIPNAGAIWKDPATGLTHLLALQLPGIPGSRIVKWQSLGTGWEGSESITMDRENFYVVWGDAVYKVPKSTPNSWSLIVANNGEDIKGIKGFQTNSTLSKGFYLIRGNCMSAVNASGTFGAFYGCNEAFSNNKSMGYYRNTANGGFSFLFRTTDLKTWSFTNLPDGILKWNSPNGIQNVGMITVVGNPMSNRFYSSNLMTGGKTILAEVDTNGEGSGVFFSDIDYTPTSSSLVVNNGYVWIMSNTLHQVMTLGSQKGQSAYNEFNWKGIELACADPTLVFN